MYIFGAYILLYASYDHKISTVQDMTVGKWEKTWASVTDKKYICIYMTGRRGKDRNDENGNMQRKLQD